MNRRLIKGAILAFVVTGATVLTLVLDRTRTHEPTQAQDVIRDQDIFGSQLMITRERDEYRILMHAAKTAQERERIRAEHYALMQERARERGVTLPDQPPAGRGTDAGTGPGDGIRK